MRIITAISCLTILPTFVAGGVVRVRFEEDGSDVKVSVRGRFDATSCTAVFRQPYSGSTTRLSLLPAGAGETLVLESAQTDFYNFLSCDAISTACPLLASDSPAGGGSSTPFSVTDTNNLPTLAVDFSFGFNDVALFLESDYEPGDMYDGEGKIAGETLTTMGLDTFSGEVCTIKLNDPGFFKTPQRIEIHVGSCGFICSVYWTIYDFLGLVFGFTYLF